MDNYWNKPPTFEPALKKKGLEPHEFESILLSKITKIFTHAEVPVDDSIKKTVTELKRDICTRENITRPGLDKRNRRAIQGSVDSGILSNADETQASMMESTGGKRGTTRFGKKHIENYHTEQHELFTKNELLGREFRNLLPRIHLKQGRGKIGFFFDDEGTKFTVENACRVIDKFTCRFLQYSKNGQDPPQNIPLVRARCRTILRRRWNVDWAIPNDLSKIGGYTEWKRHVMIGMSYAALVVVLDIMYKRRHPEAPVVNSSPRYWHVIGHIVNLFNFIVWFWYLYTLK